LPIFSPPSSTAGGDAGRRWRRTVHADVEIIPRERKKQCLRLKDSPQPPLWKMGRSLGKSASAEAKTRSRRQVFHRKQRNLSMHEDAGGVEEKEENGIRKKKMKFSTGGVLHRGKG